MAICNPRSINRKEGMILLHCATEVLDFCFPIQTWVKKDDCDIVDKLRKLLVEEHS